MVRTSRQCLDLAMAHVKSGVRLQEFGVIIEGHAKGEDVRDSPLQFAAAVLFRVTSMIDTLVTPLLTWFPISRNLIGRLPKNSM